MRQGELIGERFEIQELAGSGGMGSVYRALDRTLGGEVALKVLHLDGDLERRRFQREARTLADLRHPGIVRYVAHGATDDGSLYLAMEWIQGENLARRLGTQGLSAAESLRVVRQAAEALGVAHQRGIVHRDLKPSNLMLVGGNVDRVKLLDFGLARASGIRTDVSSTGMLLGTPNYMAPEQAEGARNLDARADVFALACLLFKCLTGQVPFAGEDLRAVLTKLLLDPAPHLRAFRPELPPTLDALVARMLARDPASRPANGTEVAALLLEIGPLADAGTTVPSRTRAITETEQRLYALLLAGDALSMPDGERTLVEAPVDEGLGALSRTTVEAHGGFVERMDALGIAASFRGTGSATDLVTQASRCALALRALWPDRPMAVATGWAALGIPMRATSLYERTVELLESRLSTVPRQSSVPPSRASMPPSVSPSRPPRHLRPIRLDDMSMNLLDARFELSRDDTGAWLFGARDAEAKARKLLGRPSPCVGRDRELVTLDAIWTEVVNDGVARVVLVTAPAGAGKSRLRYEFVNRIRSRGEDAEVWTARADRTSAGAPFGLLAPVIRHVAEVRDGEPLEIRANKLRARLGRYLRDEDRARIVTFLGELVSVSVGDPSGAQLAAARQNPVLMGDQQSAAFEDWMAAESAVRPILLVLEDLQWGDWPSLRLIDGVLRNLSDKPILVLGLARPEVHDVFPQLFRERDVTEMPIGPLSRKAATLLVREVLGGAADESTTARLVELAGGNVFYLEELMRSVAEGRGNALPPTVVAMVQERVAELEASARLVLRAASVFGRVFWRSGVEALVGKEASALVADVLDDLDDRELVSLRPGGRFPNEREYVFRHALLRDGVYAMLTDEDRKLAHRLAATWLEAVGENGARVLAEHYELGGELEAASRCYEAAALQALEGNDFVAATENARRSIAAGATGERLGMSELISAEAQRWRADHASAEALGLSALDHLPRRSSRWFDAATEVAQAAGRLRHVDRLEELAVELEALATDESSTAFIVACAVLTVQLTYVGLSAPSHRLLAWSELAFERGSREPLAEAWLHRVRGFVALYDGDTLAYLRGSERAVVSFERAGAARLACGLRVSVGFALLTLGRYEESELALRDVLVQSARMGLATQVTLAKHNLGLALARTGRSEQGLVMEREAIAECVAHGDRRIESGARGYLALILLEARDWEGALREAQGSFDVSPPPAQAFACAVMAEAELGRGQVEKALVHAEQGAALLASVGVIEEGSVRVRVTLARARDASERHAEAHDTLWDALRDLDDRAGRITDLAYRKDFVTRVPENAETLRLATLWGLSLPASLR